MLLLASMTSDELSNIPNKSLRKIEELAVVPVEKLEMELVEVPGVLEHLFRFGGVGIIFERIPTALLLLQ